MLEHSSASEMPCFKAKILLVFFCMFLQLSCELKVKRYLKHILKTLSILLTPEFITIHAFSHSHRDVAPSKLRLETLLNQMIWIPWPRVYDVERPRNQMIPGASLRMCPRKYLGNKLFSFTHSGQFHFVTTCGISPSQPLTGVNTSFCFVLFLQSPGLGSAVMSTSCNHNTLVNVKWVTPRSPFHCFDYCIFSLAITELLLWRQCKV